LTPNILTGASIPGSPYQLALGDLHVSRLLADANQLVRIYDHTQRQQMTRITSGSPSPNEYYLDSATSIATFSSIDSGNNISVTDMTYGSSIRLSSSSLAAETAIVDTLYSFAVTEEPIRTITAEFIPLTTGYTVTLVEAFDIRNDLITVEQETTVPASADGTAGRMIARLIDGDRLGTAGQFITVRLRQSIPPTGSGLLLRVRATNYDLPF
jgi:hypothetical protein